EAHPFPPEIIERIISSLFTTKSTFSTAESVFRVSHQFRTIALRIYFRRVVLPSRTGATRILQTPRVSEWLRRVIIFAHILSTSVSLRSLGLLGVEIDFSLETLGVQSFNIQDTGANLPAGLETLRLARLPYITASMLRSVASHCPSLKDLELGVMERLDTTCCWTCLADSEACVAHSPVGRHGQDFDSLVTSFSQALQPLQHLRQLSLGIFLSHSTLVPVHLDLHGPSRALAIVGTPSGDNSSAPQTPSSGCCAICIRQYSAQVRRNELLASVRLAQHLPKVESLRWGSWFTGHRVNGSEGAEVLWTTFGATREMGRVKVRRIR
ncbi:hypothetical protein K488DRAFT_55044, partial [Vararia minispora EC-137]